MKPPVSKEGKAAAGRIKEFRQNVNNGATAKQARAIGEVVQGNTPTIRQQRTLDSIENQALIPPKSTAQTGVIDAAKARNNTTITSSDLQQEPKFNLTQPNPPVQGAALSGAIEGEVDAFTKNLEAQKTQAEATKGTALDNYIASLQNRQGIEGFTTQLEDQLGLPSIEKELNKYNQDIREEQRARQNAVKSVLERGGQSKGQAQSLINNIERDSLAREADLSIIKMGIQADYDSAISRIDRKAKALYEQEQNTIDALKFNYTENKDLFTTAEQRLFETKLGDRERKLQADIDNRKQIDSFALQALQAGASVSEARQMMAAKTLDEALGIGGSYFRPKPIYTVTPGSTVSTPSGEKIKVPTFEEFIDSKQNELGMTLMPSERDKYRAEYESEVAVMEQAVKVSSLSPMAREVVNNPQAYYDLTPTVRGQVFSELAKNGIDTNTVLQGKKKALPATQAQNLAQAQGVKSDVEKLYTMLNNLPGNGPISGRIQSLNPYDPQRVAVEAQMTRIIPGLARGIFGEVGVLTDQDVARYRQTIANPNMTDTQIEQLHQDTLSKIDQSIGTTIDTFSSLGYDTGTFGGSTATDNMSDDEAYQEYLRITGQ